MGGSFPLIAVKIHSEVVDFGFMLLEKEYYLFTFVYLHFRNLPQSISTFKETQEKQSLFDQIFPSGQEMSHHEGIHIYNTCLGSKTLIIYPIH